MPVETASYISQLDENNPVGSSDAGEGDNQIKMIKGVLKTQFPNLGVAAVTVTAAQINDVVNKATLAANAYTGPQTAPTFGLSAATYFSTYGSNPLINWAANDYYQYDVANNIHGFYIGSGLQFSVGAGLVTMVGKFSQSSTANETDTINLSNTGPVGLNIKLTGNGATTPTKYLRILSGSFEIINSAYGASIFNLTDSGDLTVPGGANIGGYGESVKFKRFTGSMPSSGAGAWQNLVAHGLTDANIRGIIAKAAGAATGNSTDYGWQVRHLSGQIQVWTASASLYSQPYDITVMYV